MDEVQFKPRSYQRAARSIEALESEVESLYRRGGVKALTKIPGVGRSIAEKIEELIITEKLQYYDELKSRVPVDLNGLSRIEGVGPKTIKVLWQKLKIKDIDDLERAARSQLIRDLPGLAS